MVIGDLIGQELVSDWLSIEQGRIDEFARSTDDPQWIHIDPARAADAFVHARVDAALIEATRQHSK